MTSPEPGSAAEVFTTLDPKTLRNMADKIEHIDPARADYFRSKAAAKEVSDGKR